MGNTCSVSTQITFSLVIALVVCAILVSISGLGARWLEYAAALVAMSGVFVPVTVGSLRFKSIKIQWAVPLLMLPIAGIMELTAQGTSQLIPSLAGRAERHVNAGAEFTKIYRKAKLCRSELQATPTEAVQWNEQHNCYQELIEAYKTASSYTVIREASYNKYNNVERVFEKLSERDELFAEYKKREGIAENDEAALSTTES